MNWYSSKVRVACLIETEGVDIYMDSVYVFKAENFEDAQKRAVALGRKQEKEYMNVDKKRVRWRLKELISLDIIQRESLDGAEVYSEPVEPDAGEAVRFDAKFFPEKSDPTQTI